MSGRRLGGFCMDHWDDFVDDEIGEQMHVITRKEELRQMELSSNLHLRPFHSHHRLAMKDQRRYL